MVYRRTEKVVQRLALRHAKIIDSASAIAAEGGRGAVQIAPVAERAAIAAGTVYRYFPSKTDLVAALVAAVAEREIAALRQAAEAAPGRGIPPCAGGAPPPPQARLGGHCRAGGCRDRRGAPDLSAGTRRRVRGA